MSDKLDMIEALPIIDAEIQTAGQQLLDEYRMKCEVAKGTKSEMPARPELPDRFMGMKQGQTIVWNKVDELIKIVNELSKVVNELKK